MMRRRLTILATGAVLVGGCNSGSDGSSARSTAASSARVDSVIRVGERFFTDGQFDSARVTWSLARRTSEEGRDSSAQVRSMLSLAKLEVQVGNVREAKAIAEQALGIITRRKTTAELSLANRILGSVALGEDRIDDAAVLFQRSLDQAKVEANRLDEVQAAGNLGLAWTYLGDYTRARAAHRQARMAGRSLGDLRIEGKGLANEAMIDNWVGDPRSAIARLDTARSLYRQSDYEPGEEHALGQLATAYELTGEENRSFALLDTALVLARKLGMVDEELDDLRLLAGLHLRLGDARRALEVYRDAEARMREAGISGNLGSLLRGSAEANLRLGNTAVAEQQLSEALTRHAASAEPSDRLDDLLLGAELDQRTGRLARADARLREAATLADQLNTRGARIGVAVADAHIADLRGDARRALRALSTVAPEMAAGDYGAEWTAQALASRAYARLGNLDSAAALGRRAVGAVERLRGELASEALRSSYIVDRAETYGDLVLTLLRLGRTAEAFAVADAARSRELLGYLGAVRADPRSLGAPAELVESDRLLRRIDALVARLRTSERQLPRERGTLVNDPSAAIVEALTEARGRYEALIVRAAQTRRRATTVLNAQPTRVDEIQRALRPNEAMLEYMVAGTQLLTFAITREQLRVFHRDIDRESLTQRVWLLRDIWGSPQGDWRDGVAAARALHDVLIAPAEDAGVLRDVRRVVVVPLGVLSQVPFPALIDSHGDFVVRRYEVIHLPSAGSLVAVRSDSSSTTPLEPSAGVAFAPFPTTLPATATEAETFRASGAGRAANVGAGATEASLRRALSTSGVVHVATHAILNVRNPVFSRLELARGSDSNPDDDGRLEVHEILALVTRSPLVFLSGCETGANQGWSDDPVRGTGDLTLAQAVLASGAPNVIMTLWRIDDAGAAEFAKLFYRHLQTVDVSTALADAQRGMASDRRYASPYYWAGYTLSGRGELRAPQSPIGLSVSLSSHVGATALLPRNRP